jgi:hypothetical protein
MRNTQMRYCTNMTDHLSNAQGKALKHKVTVQPLHQSDDNEIIWSYEVECEGKIRLGPSREKTYQVAEVGKQICKCTCRKPQLLHIPCSHVIAYAMNCSNSTSIGTCHGTSPRNLFGTFGIEQFRVTSCRVLFY